MMRSKTASLPMFAALRAQPADLDILASVIAEFDERTWRTWLEYTRSYVVLLTDVASPRKIIRDLKAAADAQKDRPVCAERLRAIATEVDRDMILTSPVTPDAPPLSADDVWTEVMKTHRAAFATCGTQVAAALEPGLSASRLLTVIDPYLLNLHQARGLEALLRQTLRGGTSSFEFITNWAAEEGYGCQRFWVPRHGSPSALARKPQATCAKHDFCKTIDEVETRVRGLVAGALQDVSVFEDPSINITLVLRKWSEELTHQVHDGTAHDGHDRILALTPTELGPSGARVITVGRGVSALVDDDAKSTTVVGRLPPQSYVQAASDYRIAGKHVVHSFEIDVRMLDAA